MVTGGKERPQRPKLRGAGSSGLLAPRLGLNGLWLCSPGPGGTLGDRCLLGDSHSDPGVLWKWKGPVTLPVQSKQLRAGCASYDGPPAGLTPEPGSPAGLQKASSLPDPAETASESLTSRTCHPHVPELPPLATQHTQGPLVSLPPVLTSTSFCCLSPSRPGPRGSGEAHDDDT